MTQVSSDKHVDRKLGSFLGGIVGDAYGSQYEFRQRDTYRVSKNMGTNVFGLPPGSFTDDSSMMLCLAASLIEKKGFDPVDQMQRYLAWRQDGYMSSSDKRACFDIGRTTANALSQFCRKHEQWIREKKEKTGPGDVVEAFNPYFGSTDPRHSGNGAIMRLAPVPIAYAHDAEAARKYSVLSSKTTHASPECLEAAALMSDIIVALINGGTKNSTLTLTGEKEPYETQTVDSYETQTVDSYETQTVDSYETQTVDSYETQTVDSYETQTVDSYETQTVDSYETQTVQNIARGTFLTKPRNEIDTSGYVIHTLEAALWAFHKTKTFEEGLYVLAAMGRDVDTVCCVYGQIAGAFYGYASIPGRWMDALQKIDLVASVAANLCVKGAL